MSKIKDVLVIDILTIPNGLTLQEIMYAVTEHGVVIWDSTRGIEPKLIPSETFGKFENIKVVDIITAKLTDKEKKILNG